MVVLLYSCVEVSVNGLEMSKNICYMASMITGYSAYQPLILGEVSVEQISSAAYRDFVYSSVILPGCRLLIERSRRNSSWPYLDTKFNPNTGRDLPPESYNKIYTWILGRGAEALQGHLPCLDVLPGLEENERQVIRESFLRWIGRMTESMQEILRINDGRIPFCVDKNLHAIDPQGRSTRPDSSRTGAGDIFAAKGLLSSDSSAAVECGLALMMRSAGLIKAGRFEIEQCAAPVESAQGPYMLMLGAAVHACRTMGAGKTPLAVLDMAAEFLTHVLDWHYDPATAIFSEYVNMKTGEKKPWIDPGHATEFVGFALAAADCLDEASRITGRNYQPVVSRARRELPRLLLKAGEFGFNDRHPGIFKLVNNSDGVPIDANMPWWNLPETMRAAVRAVRVADVETGKQCLRLYARCHNAYFSQYLNRENMLFPFQTISGKTGQVVDIVPALPEGDPLYHANLTLLDITK
jgi:hypothetical protein